MRLNQVNHTITYINEEKETDSFILQLSSLFVMCFLTKYHEGFLPCLHSFDILYLSGLKIFGIVLSITAQLKSYQWQKGIFLLLP